jgi:hypothetical protein
MDIFVLMEVGRQFAVDRGPRPIISDEPCAFLRQWSIARANGGAETLPAELSQWAKGAGEASGFILPPSFSIESPRNKMKQSTATGHNE